MEISGAGIRAFCLFEDGGTKYELDGAHVDPASTIRTEKITRANGKGGLRTVAKRFITEINHGDAALHALMEAGNNNNVQWKAQVAGFAYNMMCLEVNTFTVESEALADPASEDFPFTIRYEVVGQRIGAGINLIHVWYRSQGGSIPANGTLTETIDVPFPFEGLDLTLSNGATDITLTALDSANASLASSSTTTGAGRVSVQLVTPENTFTARCVLADVQDPALRVDGKTTSPNA